MLVCVLPSNSQQDGSQCDRQVCLGIDWQNVQFTDLAELDPNAASVEGRKPMHYAAYNCSSSAVFTSLFERGADPNVADPNNGLTPLQIAIIGCRTGTVKNLLAHGADPEAETLDGGGNTMHLALRANAPVATMKALIEGGVDLEAIDEHGNTPLVYFVANDNTNMMHVLLDAGANPSAVDGNGHSVVHYAASHGDLGLLKKLLSLDADLGAVANSGITPLHLASEHGLTPELVGVFHVAKVDSNRLDETGRAPVHYAAANANAAGFIALVALGADPLLADSLGDVPLHYALRHNSDAEVIELLLGWGNDPNLPTIDGELPLLIATRLNNDGAVTALLEYGANIDAADNRGRTLLHHAVRDGNSEAVSMLVKKGADVFAEDILGDSPATIYHRYELTKRAVNMIGRKVKEREKLLLEQQQRLLEEQQLAEEKYIAEKERREALNRQRLEKRTQIKTVSEANIKLKGINKERQRAQEMLERASRAGQEARVAEFTKQIESLDARIKSVNERVKELEENPRGSR